MWNIGQGVCWMDLSMIHIQSDQCSGQFASWHYQAMAAEWVGRQEHCLRNMTHFFQFCTWMWVICAFALLVSLIYQCKYYPSTVAHTQDQRPQELSIIAFFPFFFYCSLSHKQNLLKEKKINIVSFINRQHNKTLQCNPSLLLYTLMTWVAQDQSGRGFTVNHDATTIHKDVYGFYA